jgi:hypothetical protein
MTPILILPSGTHPATILLAAASRSASDNVTVISSIFAAVMRRAVSRYGGVLTFR